MEHDRSERSGFPAAGILASVSDPVVVFDRTASVRWWNDALSAATGRGDADLTDCAVSDLFDEATQAASSVDAALEGDESTFVATLSASDDGGVRHVEFSVSRHDDGADTFAVAIGRDITERHARAVDADQYEVMFDSLTDAMYAIESDGTFRYVNDRYVEMKGVDRAELLGTNVDDWVTEETVKQADEMRALLSSGEQDVATVEYEFITVDGERTPAELRFGAVDGDTDLARVGTIRDVTERAEREAALRRQNERLDEFASIVSHDLRNPLNVAEGRLELARREHDNEHLEAVAAAHTRMRTLIEDILTLAREGTVDLSPTETALEPLVEGCWQSVTSPSATLDVRADATFLADERQLRRLLENLFRNAVEHGGAGVNVTVGLLDDGFYVEDDGPGIDDEAKAKVFDAAYSTSDEGTGLGLRIVQEIANRHGWSVRATDAATGGGARFEVTGVTRS